MLTIFPLTGKSGMFPTIDPITVFIAEAHILLRQALNELLARQEDIQVVGEAAEGLQMLCRLEALQPHVLLLDMQLPEMGGLEALLRLRVRSPRTKIVILADAFDEEFITRALQGGVQGFMLKTALPTELVKAIHSTHTGELWAQRRLLTRVVENLRRRVDELQGFPSELWEALTDREQEVSSWAAQGMTNEEIATQLGISAKTVKTHLEKVFRKLNIRRRVQLARFPLTSSPTFPASPPRPPPSA
jgi:two-component system, NarL family, response regulator NreC